MKYVKIFENFEIDDDIEDILDGYIQCALWIEEFDDKYSFDDVDDKTLNFARKEIGDFLDQLEEEEILDVLQSEIDNSQIGHDFWLTRNGHGAGFWDRDLEDVGKIASKVSEKFQNRYVYEQNGKIYIE